MPTLRETTPGVCGWSMKGNARGVVKGAVSIGEDGPDEVYESLCQLNSFRGLAQVKDTSVVDLPAARVHRLQ